MTLVLKAVEDGIARITLNRPDKRNALSSELVAELTRSLKSAAGEVRVILLCGAGKSFCAGADLTAVGGLQSETEIRAHAEATGTLFRTLGQLPVPTIAVVTGHALGAGCGLVSLCDLAIAEPAAQLGYPEFRHGILPALVTPPLVRAVGKRRAFQILTRSSSLTAEEAHALGLIGEIAEDPEAVALRHARHLTKAAPCQVAALKTLLDLCANDPDGQSDPAAIEANIEDRLVRTRSPSKC